MSAVLEPEKKTPLTLEDLLDKFGPIPFHRICTYKPPGEATEEDALWLNEHGDRLCELIDGILVEKAMSRYESYLAIEIAAQLRNFVKPRKLGAVLGADGMLRLSPGLIRIPDVTFILAAKLIDNALRKHAVARLGPDLAVEVLSESNTDKETERKLRDYFDSGAQLVWIVDPEPRTLVAYASPTTGVQFQHPQRVSAAPVLPGFELDLQELFADPALGAS